MQDLVSVAETLAKVDSVWHRRRAISSAYYALFQRLQKACADQFVGEADFGSENWNCVFRALNHRTAKAVCASIIEAYNELEREISKNGREVEKQRSALKQADAEHQKLLQVEKSQRKRKQILDIRKSKYRVDECQINIDELTDKANELKEKMPSRQMYEFAIAFNNLQNDRHNADYHPQYQPDLKNVEAAITSAAQALQLFDDAPDNDRIYLVIGLMFKRRDDSAPRQPR